MKNKQLKIENRKSKMGCDWPLAPGPWTPEKYRASNGQRGFTLLEILLAIGLLAVVSLIVYGSFRATVSAMERSATHGAAARQARVVLSRLSDELSAVDWAPGRDDALFVGTLEEIDGRPAGRLQFTSRSHVWYPNQPPATERAAITYTADLPTEAPASVGGTESEPALQLWRQEATNPFAVGGEAPRLMVAEGLVGVQFRFYADDAWTDGWDAGSGNKLPELVEVTLLFSAPGGREEEYRTIIALPLGTA